MNTDTPTPITDAAEIIESDSSYGFFHGGDPRNFHPDSEGVTDTERENHRKACQLWNEAEARGETPTPEECPSGWIRDAEGKPIMHVLRAPYGIGVTSEEIKTGRVAIEVARNLERVAKQLADAQIRLIETCGSNIATASDEDLAEAAALIHDTDAANAAKAFIECRAALAAWEALGK